MKLFDVALSLGSSYSRRLVEIKTWGENSKQAADMVKETVLYVAGEEPKLLTVTLHEAEELANESITADLIGKLADEDDMESKIINDDNICIRAAELMSLMNIAYKLGYSDAVDKDMGPTVVVEETEAKANAAIEVPFEQEIVF